MKYSRAISCAVACLAIAASAPISSFADDAVAISAENASLANAVNGGEMLDSPLSPGIRVIAYRDPMILSGKTGERVQFNAEVFNDHNGYVPSSVTVVSLPSDGALMYDSEPVTTGQKISVLTLSSLYYEPGEADDVEFTFSADDQSLMRCRIRQRDRENTTPEITGDGAITTWTRMDTAVAGYLSGSDPDGDNVRFEITSYPSKGIVSIADSSTGRFIYEPYEGMSGNDTFTYRICDFYGSYSDDITQTVTVDSKKANAYDDMEDSYSASAVNDAVDAGIMQTQKTADAENFMPDEPVSRIDFLIMTMKAMGAGEVEPTATTVFSDDSTLTDEEKGYLSAAYRLGIIKGTSVGGKLTFSPDEAVTGASAAVMINGILRLPGDDTVSVFAMSDSVPSWALSSVSALTVEGVINKYTAPAGEILTRENVAVILSGLMRRVN